MYDSHRCNRWEMASLTGSSRVAERGSLHVLRIVADSRGEAPVMPRETAAVSAPGNLRSARLRLMADADVGLAAADAHQSAQWLITRRSRRSLLWGPRKLEFVARDTTTLVRKIYVKLILHNVKSMMTYVKLMPQKRFCSGIK